MPLFLLIKSLDSRSVPLSQNPISNEDNPPVKAELDPLL